MVIADNPYPPANVQTDSSVSTEQYGTYASGRPSHNVQPAGLRRVPPTAGIATHAMSVAPPLVCADSLSGMMRCPRQSPKGNEDGVFRNFLIR